MESMRRNEANTSHHPNKVSSRSSINSSSISSSSAPFLHSSAHSSTPCYAPIAGDKNCNYFIVICSAAAAHLARPQPRSRLGWASSGRFLKWPLEFTECAQADKAKYDDNNGQNGHGHGQHEDGGIGNGNVECKNKKKNKRNILGVAGFMAALCVCVCSGQHRH